MAPCAGQWSGSGPTDMNKVAIIAALEREVSGLTMGWIRVERDYEGRSFIFFERDEMVVVCGGIGLDAARRAAEAAIDLYRPTMVQSVGFAGALDASLRVGDILAPAVVIDARDGSRVEIEGGNRQGTLVSFVAVAGIEQKANLALAYGARAVDMEASAVAAAACAHGIQFDATKAISDEYDFEMPGTARFIDAQGRFNAVGFALFAALRPWLWPRVMKLAANSRKAAGALGEHLRRLRQELSQASGRLLEQVAEPPAPVHPEAATSGLPAGGRQ
jgi:adenosylhomocysteine nucleosidase